MAAENQSFEALHVQKPSEDPEEEEQDDDDDDDDENEDDEEEEASDDEHKRRPTEDQEEVESELGNAQLQTLTSTEPSSLSSLSKNDDLQSDFISSSQLLSVLPLNYATEMIDLAQFKSISAVQSPTVTEQTASTVPNVNGVSIAEVNQRTSEQKTISASLVIKAPSSDGFKWRKYGQKQVKSPKGSRSYYKCTYSDCYAKKIECSGQSSGVMEMIYKGQHNHEPPRMINCTRGASLVSHGSPAVEYKSTFNSVQDLDSSDPSTRSKEPTQETAPMLERKQQNFGRSDGNIGIKAEDDHLDKPELKRRSPMGKTSNLEHSSSPSKPGKKPKFVVHAAGDVGISEDGYRWRKYGQKMVKGNPHPRNYYRCTSAGCPVRKHIETSVDSTGAVIITYKGIHDHDMPVPKKRHGRLGARLVAAAAPASMSKTLQLKKAEEITPTQWPVDREGELTGEMLDLGGEKAIESARTLLSIGFEIKPC